MNIGDLYIVPWYHRVIDVHPRARSLVDGLMEIDMRSTGHYDMRIPKWWFDLFNAYNEMCWHPGNHAYMQRWLRECDRQGIRTGMARRHISEFWNRHFSGLWIDYR